MLIIYFFIIIIYIILINLLKKKEKKNDFLVLERANNLIKLYKFIKFLNISIIIIDFIYYFVLFLLKNDINLTYCVINILLIITSIIYCLRLNSLTKNKKHNFNYIVLNEYEYKYKLIYIYNIILTLILIAAKIINTIIEKKEIQKNNNILLKGNIAVPVGFYICITNIFALILQTYLFFITSG